MDILNTKKPQDLPELHWRVLGAIPSGSDNSITISYVMDKLSLRQSERRKVNFIINELIFKYGYPIGTSSDDETRGIFFIESEADLTLASRTLNSRAMANLKRHRQIIDNYNRLDQIEASI